MTAGFDLNAFTRDGFSRFGGPDVAAAKARAEASMLDAAHIIAVRTLGADAPRKAALGDQLAAMHAAEADNAATRACYEVFPTLPEVIALINAEPFLSAARQAGLTRPVAGTNPLVRLDRPGDTRFSTPWHQDYWYSLLSERAVVIWMALGELDASMGPVELLAGSHADGLVPFKPYEAGHEWFETAEPVREDGIVAGLHGPDEAVIFDQRVLHRSGFNASDRVRVTIQLRYNDLDALSELTSTFTPSLSRFVLERQKALLEQAEEARHDA
ncbi:MAG: phytanoyl-CoA dioxygenase family protein [Alphaproteobacteria bacterium]|nr:phytanoyl-CoA dioxygenase family protein [Alphaproteobacteria bacterium]